jgi:hypothetical protein
MAWQHYFRYESMIEPTLESLIVQDIHHTKKRFIKSLLSASTGAPVTTVSRKQVMSKMNALCESPKETISSSRLSRIISEMKEAGAFNEYRIPEKKTIILEVKNQLQDYLLSEIDRGGLRVPPQVHVRLAKHQRELLERSSSVCLLDVPYGHFGMRLMQGILDGFVRASKHDSRRVIPRTPLTLPMWRSADEKVYETIEIQTECKSGDDSAIMELSDLAVLGALNSMYVESITEQYGTDPDRAQVPQTFVFDILDLCKALDVERRSREHIVRRLQRIRDTIFTINVKNAPEFRRLFNLGILDKREFQYLTEFGYATEEVVDDFNPVTSGSYRRHQDEQPDQDLFGSNDMVYDAQKGVMVRRVPRFYFVRFDSLMFDYMISDSERHRFTFDPKLLNENQMGLIHRIHSWARAFIGVRPRSDGREVSEFTLDEFNTHLLPTTPRKTFFNLTRTVIDKHLIDRRASYSLAEINRAALYGYFIEVDHRKETLDAFYRKYPGRRPRKRGGDSKIDAIVRVQRDRSDQYVGDNSAHNQLLRQSRLEFA